MERDQSELEVSVAGFSPEGHIYTASANSPVFECLVTDRWCVVLLFFVDGRQAFEECFCLCFQS